MKRAIIRIDEAKCTGCGLCIPECHEGALRIVDGKARLVSDVMCDGLGACLGTCPEGAITIEEREAGPYDESGAGARDATERRPPSAPVGRSELTHWPVQMHLIAPGAPHFRGSDLVLAADCVGYALGDFHGGHLKGKTLAIACPKLDEGQEIYLDKLKALIDDAKINTLTVMIMQVPCCKGLLALARGAAAQASRKVPVKCIVVSPRGEVLTEEWVS